MKKVIKIRLVNLIFPIILLLCIVGVNTETATTKINEIISKNSEQIEQTEDIVTGEFFDFEEEDSENAEEEVESEYVEGEVIIKTYAKDSLSTLSVQSATKESSIWDNLEIEKFAEMEVEIEDADENEETVENTDESTMSISSVDSEKSVESTNSAVVEYSLVKSDEYTTEELINLLEKENEVIYVQPNYVYNLTDLTNDTYESYQWAIENTGQNGGTAGNDINPFTTDVDSSNTKVIAILDSGVDYTHEDLVGHLWTDSSGKYGYDFMNGDDDPIDDLGHGTHVAGIIAATSNNETGITGTVLDNNVQIMTLKIANELGGTSSYYAIQAYGYLYDQIENGTNIVAINNSWGGEFSESDPYDTSLNDWIDKLGKKGALSVCASGNSGADNDETAYIPAGLDSQYIISVGASDESDNLANFSNYGDETTDIAAPGTAILSTWNTNVFNPSIYDSDKISELCNIYYNYDELSTATNNREFFLATKENDEYVLVDDSQYKATINSDTYFGKSGKSLELTITNTTSSYEVYYLYLPFTITGTGTYYASVMAYSPTYRYWQHSTGSVAIESTNSVSWIQLTYVILPAGTSCTYYFDDYAVSKCNVDSSKFGKYEFDSGTSMSAPFVTAAVAMISNKYGNNLSTLNIKSTITQSVRESTGLSGKVATGGTLDLSKISDADIPPTLDLSTNSSNPTCGTSATFTLQDTLDGRTYQYSLDKGTTWNECTNNQITLTGGDGTYAIILKQTDGSATSDTYYYTLDTVAPVISDVSPSSSSKYVETQEVSITITENGSGLASDTLYYAVLEEDASTSSISYKSTTISNNTATITLNADTTGLYYLYIKPLEDKAGNASSTTNHKFGTYALLETYTYTITYEANGGTGAPSAQEVSGTTKTLTATLSSTKPTRTGYTFKGWGTKSTSTSAKYSAGSSISLTGDITLYAVWSGTSSTSSSSSDDSSNTTKKLTSTNTVLSDTTTSTSSLPNTGMKAIIAIVVIIVIAGVFTFLRYKDFDDIK